MKKARHEVGMTKRPMLTKLEVNIGTVVAACFFLGTLCTDQAALADEFPPYPDRSEATETCKQAVADFYNGRVSEAAREMEMSEEDIRALKNIWLTPKVPDDQFVNVITADYVSRNSKKLKVVQEEKKFAPIPFLGLTFAVNLPENEVGAELECMFRSYGKAWKLKDLKLGRAGTRIFTTYPVTPKAAFPGFPHK